MIEDNELIARLRLILSESDLSSITINMIVRQLEEYYKCDLNEKKIMLKDALNAYIQEKLENDNIFDDNDDDDDDGDKIKAEDYDDDDDDDDAEIKINENDDGDNTDEPKEKKKGGGGFTKPVQLSTDLSEFVGGDVSLPRTEVTKRIWNYIREHNLQNPDDKREILCDETLEKLFKRKKMTMFKMTKYLAPMMKAIDSLQEVPSKKIKSNASPKPKSKAVKSEGSSNSKAGKNDNKKVKTEKVKSEKKSGGGGGGGFTAVCDLSPALGKFLGVDELPRTQVISKMWDYIKENNLQNPDDRREIVLDKKMKEIFVGLDTVTMFSINKHLAKHIYKKEK